MKEITIKDVRRAINYVCQNDGLNLQDCCDEQLSDLDFGKDLNIGNIRLVNITIELQRMHAFDLPWDVLHTRKDNTVGTYLGTINQYLSDNG